MPGYSQSAIAYWVGKAKDSTGTVTPYAAARNTTGGGVTWVTGQLWSETARQWGIRATDPGNLAYSKGANQDWSVSASQWKTNYDTEWAAARDPQGYAHSYPGQAPNAVYWSQSASYWRGQANYYFGPSRVWGSGNTWEYLTGYHGWISRGYGSGESWEAAYNRVYTDRYNEGYNNGVNAYTSASWRVGINHPGVGNGEAWMNLNSGSPNGNYFTNSGTHIYLVRAGYWAVAFGMDTRNVGASGNFGWGNIQTSLVSCGNTYQIGVELSSDADEYNDGAYCCGFAAPTQYSNGGHTVGVYINPDGMGGSGQFSGHIYVAFLGPGGLFY